MPEREHVTVDGAMRKRESVRDQVENGDSKSRKGVSHLTVSRGVITPVPAPQARFRSSLGHAKYNTTPAHLRKKSVNREAILGRRKRRHDISNRLSVKISLLVRKY